MKLLSSGWTFPMKWIFPYISLGIAFIAFFGGHPSDWHDPGLWIFFGIALVMWFFLFSVLMWNLADEVQDCGSYLIVRRGSVQERIELSDIINVITRQFSNPRRLTLRLRTPGTFVKQIAFLLKSSLNPFARNALAEDLIERIHFVHFQARP